MKFLKEFIKKYFSTFIYFYRYLGNKIFIVLGLSIAVGTLDAFGLTMFLPLLELADGNGAATGEGLGQLAFIIEWLNNKGIDLTIVVALYILLLFFILKGIAVYISEIYQIKTSQFFISSIRLKLTKLFTNYSYKNFVTSDVGRIQNNFTGEVSRVSRAYSHYSSGIRQLLMTLVYLVFVVLIDWQFAVLVGIGGLLTNILYGRIYKKTKQESYEISKKNSSYHKAIIQYINNFKYLKATGLLSKYTITLQDNIKNIEASNKKIGMLSARISASREPLLILVVVLVIIFQVYFLDGKLAGILMSLLLFYRALVQLMSFQTTYNSFLSVSGALDNMMEFEKELNEAAEKDGKVKFKEFNQEIKLNQIDFGYKPDGLILKNINLTISKQQSIAFVGESGSGKTTLVNVISGLLNTTNGELLIDSQNINTLKKETYQKRIGYIAQEPVIFNDTIFNNVTFWAEPTEENIKRFQKATEQASILDFINTLKEQEHTLLGNNGINLSGGQKQRISIARELYKDIDILILDEATSALDSETEKEIQYNIDDLKGDYTIIIIAHRLSTIKNVDKVYLMDKGEIIGQGDFEELTASSERFRRMVELQEI